MAVGLCGYIRAMISARAAYEALREGNRRFVSELGSAGASHARRRELPAGQEPLAIILGCSDARVPAELVFDQGLGDLFVIRVAGNIVAPSQIGSVEFAAEAFHTRLVVVLGHSNCGAVQATLQQLARPWREQSRNLSSIVNRIRPAVEGLLEQGARARPADAGTTGGARQHPHVGRSSAPRIGSSRAADPPGRADGRRRRVFARDRGGGFLRRRSRASVKLSRTWCDGP